MKRPNDHDAHAGLKEARHRVRKPHPKPRARMSWLEAIIVGVIAATVIGVLAAAGQWLDSIDFARIFS